MFRDLTAPVVTLSHTFLATNSQVRFNWTANEPASFLCKIDSGAFQACTSGKAYTLNEGTRAFTLRATDPAGNTADFTRDVRVLDTILLSGPKTFERVRTATFKIRSVAGVDFDCRLDPPGPASPPFADCGPKGPDGTLTIPHNASTLTQDGDYTFQARSRDAAILDQTPLTRTWTIDTVAPNTTLSSPDLPEGVVTTLLDAAFSFASTEPLGALQCSADGSPFAVCTSPRTLPDLSFGEHTFQVRSVDRAGNIDPTPAVRHWTIAARDNDGDGFNQRSDCNDTDPGINPNARDIPGNRIDEDCDGVAAPFPRLNPAVTTAWVVDGRDFELTRLAARDIPAARKSKSAARGSPAARSNEGRPRASPRTAS